MQFIDMSSDGAMDTSEFIKNVLNKQSSEQTKRIIDKISEEDKK